MKIIDKNGIELPTHYSGRERTESEAIKLLKRLNFNGEHRPYTVIRSKESVK